MDIKLLLLVIFFPPLLGLVTHFLIRGLFEDILLRFKKREIKGFAGYFNLFMGYMLISLAMIWTICLILRFNFEIYEPLSASAAIFVLSLIFMVRIQIVAKGPQYVDILGIFIGASFLIVFTNLLFHPEYLTSFDAHLALIGTYLIFARDVVQYVFYGSLCLTFLAEPLIQSFFKEANI